MADMDTQAKLPLSPESKNEIATARVDITLPFFGEVLRSSDDVLLQRGGADGLKIYDALERDAEVFSNMQKRKLAVIGRPWMVDPASDDALDVKAAELVKAQLTELNFDQVTQDLLDAILKGFAVGEIVWELRGSEVWASQVLPRNQRRFTFNVDRQLRMLVMANAWSGVALPERKFIVHSFGSKDGNPHGIGLGHRLFWPCLFKRQDISAWLVFNDKFASPTAVGKYPSGTEKPDQDKLLSAITTIAQETAFTIPEGMMVEFLEATRSGSTDAYERMARYMDEQIGKIILSDAEGAKNGGGAVASAANVRKEVRLELVKADADLLSDTLKNTLVRWIVEYNLPGARLPNVRRDVQEPEDLKVRSERDKNLAGMGFRPTLKHVQEIYGGEWEVVPQNNVTGRNVPPASFAEAGLDPTDQTMLALEAAVNLISPQLQKIGRTMLADVVKTLNDANSFEEAFHVLAEAWPMVKDDSLIELLGQAELVSQLMGQQSAANEIKS